MAKKITLENLADKMDKGFEKVDKRFGEAEKHFDKKIDKKIDGLALMVGKGFDENTAQHQRFLDKFDNLEQGQEDIKLRLDNVAYRFEIVDLDKRLKKLEVKLGIA